MNKFKEAWCVTVTLGWIVALVIVVLGVILASLGEYVMHRITHIGRRRG